MLKQENVRELFSSPFLNQKYQECDNAEAPAALPDASLEFLIELCVQLGIKRILSLEVGEAPKSCSKAGFSVISLEDSHYWKNETLANLTESERVHHTSFVKPFAMRFLWLFSIMDWHIDDKLAHHIKEAELILVDSSHYTLFRESTLWSALTIGNGAIVVIDDTRIPTLKRFCDRLSCTNPGSLLHSRVSVGHGFDIFYHKPEEKLSLNHSIIDAMKGWYRYFQGHIFYFKLKWD